MLAGAVIFLSAFLLFAVQPLTAKALLPWFGGAASVWTTCVLAFQCLLLAGYGYSHWLSRRPSQGRIHMAIALFSLLALPILPSPSWKPLDSALPISRILACLGATVGIPYFLLSTTSPLVSAWAARRGMREGAYRLFGLSNAGAFLGLLGYPFLIEPNLSLRAQGLGWSALYGVLVLLLVALARQAPALPSCDYAEVPAPGLLRQLSWTAWACCSNVLLLGVTSFLTQNVAPIPFLWVVPLALYLLSWILCFSFPGFYRRALLWPLLGLFWIGMLGMVGDQSEALVKILPLFLGGLLVACCVCHGELAESKPDSALLTHFYLLTSVGGAVGGILVGVGAPYLFSDNYELPLGMFFCVLLMLSVRSGPWRLLPLALALWMLGSMGPLFRDDSLVRVRNFYACLKVSRVADLLKLSHGAIHHGSQFEAPARQREPIGYYGPESGVGRGLRTGTAHRVGVIGLGTGTLAAYAQPGDAYVLYEINPQVVELAGSRFTYLKNCRGTTQVVEGDARLALEREPAQNFDLLAVDAFAGDAVPLHLLTREAFALYFRHLKADGLLALHVSNRYLDLEPVITAAAQQLGKEGVFVHSDADWENGISGATWLLFGAPGQATVAALRAEGYPAASVKPGVAAWSDDHCSLWDVLDLDELYRGK